MRAYSAGEASPGLCAGIRIWLPHLQGRGHQTLPYKCLLGLEQGIHCMGKGKCETPHQEAKDGKASDGAQETIVCLAMP